ncbi:germination protein, Ger(x)C family [Caminicella sporogenes DSM 14501]|uniref:Germination protein, Ger(X)C family n=1 Tax=Caminicella sporogenes DSM 14501 TaxID=1121266 RepID=A0A1M6PNV6_9FIRM|nr:Ger(x)C family spore germination protein [Caminicella sporogenes]RKD22032.1 hypothetical protein BET04_07220 [Caminicella sporogenes]SHK09636.1 germination protein, Ger(x)C family [Caminicella sporogenes DSM 14501]
MDRKKRIFIVVFIVVFLLTGCWDAIEIDERAFITAIGWDKYKGDKEEQDKGYKSVKNRYVMTVTYPNVSVIAGKGEGDPSYIISTICSTPSDGKQQANIRNNKNFYINHAKVVLVGKELAEDEKLMREIIDVFQRSVYINRKIYFCYTPGKAKDILMMDTKKNMDIGLFIEELMEKEMISSRRARADFNKMVIDLKESNAAMIPQIIASKGGELKVLGTAVLKGNKVVGTLNGIETRDILILKGRAKVVDYDIKVGDLVIIIEQMSINSKMKVHENSEGKIIINFDIRAEGIVLQHDFKYAGRLMDAHYIEKINKEAEKQIVEELKRTFKRVQKEYKVDLFKAGEYLRKHEPKTWDKVKDNWEEVYANAQVNINFDMNIRRIGIEG